MVVKENVGDDEGVVGEEFGEVRGRDGGNGGELLGFEGVGEGLEGIGMSVVRGIMG